LGIEV